MSDSINVIKPKFITLEGGEGSGKSTQANLLQSYLQQKGIESILTREIGGTDEAEKIRELIFANKLHNISEIMLVMAARHEHLTNVIKPALAKGIWVICDRFFDSTLAYQGSGVLNDVIIKLHDMIFQNFLPNQTFLIDIDPEIGIKRAKKRGELNKFDKYNLSFHNEIRKKFIDIAKNNDKRITIIDGNESVDIVQRNILSSLMTQNQPNT